MAHELGHAGNLALSLKYQPVPKYWPSMFFIEAPSTMNELLLGNYLLSISQDIRFRRAVISGLLSTYYHNFVNHLLEGELLHRVYALAEQGRPLTAATFGEQKLDVLKAGGSRPPLELMQHVGVDMTTPEPLVRACAYVGALVDELEKSFLQEVLAVNPIIACLAQYPPIVLGLVASLLAGLATSIGAIPVFLARRVPEKLYDGLPGFAAGIMLAATFFSLILPASKHGGGGATSSLNRIWLFIIAITIHNFPEGLAVGVGVGSGDLANGISLAIGIALQNIPEGLAGAMLFVISDETIPETHKRGNERVATYLILLGFILMMFLDTTLG